MKTTSILGAVLASAAVASAQVKYEDGKYICEQENAAYCAGDSMGTDIIIRCNGKVGQPGRCTNNLAGQPPLGVKPALCWQTSPTSGDAACEKNCVVYGSSGNYNGTFTLPADVCTPTYTATSSPSSLSSLTGVPTQTEETTLTTTICPPTTETISPTNSPSSSSEPPHSFGNSTVTTAMTNPPLTHTTALTNPPLTRTTALTNPPVSSPNATRTGSGGGGAIHTGAASSNQAAGALVVLGGMMAFLL